MSASTSTATILAPPRPHQASKAHHLLFASHIHVLLAYIKDDTEYYTKLSLQGRWIVKILILKSGRIIFSQSKYDQTNRCPLRRQRQWLQVRLSSERRSGALLLDAAASAALWGLDDIPSFNEEQGRKALKLLLAKLGCVFSAVCCTLIRCQTVPIWLRCTLTAHTPCCTEGQNAH